MIPKLRDIWVGLRDRKIPLIERLQAAREALGPVFALISNPQAAGSLPRGGELVAKLDRSGVEAESFRSLRAAIAMNARVANQKVFLFTSAVPSEGKSFCSSNFAVTLAQQGLRTLLVDADLRKPTLSGLFFGMNRRPGLAEVLSGQVDLASAVHSSGEEGLSVLTAGGGNEKSSEILAGQSVRNFIADALKSYDRVVIDSAPLMAVSDTLLIAPHTDVRCLVVRAYMTPKKLIMRAVKLLDDVHAKPGALVFNGIPKGTGSYSYYGKYYGQYSSKSE